MMKKILKAQSLHWVSLEQAKFSECVFQTKRLRRRFNESWSSKHCDEFFNFDDNQRIASRSELLHKQHTTRNVIAICMWSFRFDENKLDEVNAFFRQSNNAAKSLISRMKATTKFSRKKKFNFLRKRITKKKKNDIFVRVENDIINKEFIENVATMNDIFVSRSLKLRIAFLTLQENDQFVQRMRSYCVKSQSMKSSFENVSEDDSDSQRALSKNDAITQ